MDINSPIKDIIDIYSEQCKIFDNVLSSDFYFFTIKEDEEIYYTRTHPENRDFRLTVPHITGQMIATFYLHIGKQLSAFPYAQKRLAELGRDFPLKSSMTASDLKNVSLAISQYESDLVTGFRLLNNTKAEPGYGFFRRPEIERVLIKRFITENLSGEKPETFRETVRRYIPRFMTQPIPFPKWIFEDAGNEVRDIIKSWTSYSAREGHYLIHPDNFALGAPFHIVFRIASKLESVGQDDLGFAVRVYAVKFLLEMERERSLMSDKAEIPLLTYMLKGEICGSVFGYERIANSCDDVLTKTMAIMYYRFQNELFEGKDGVATEFVKYLQKLYADDFSMCFANGLFNYSFLNGKLNALDVLNKLKEVGWEKFDEIYKHALNVTARPVFNFREIKDVIDTMPAVDPITDTSDLLSDIKTLIEDGDSFSYRKRFSKLKLKKGDATFGMTIDLEPLSEIVYAQFNSAVNDQIRQVNFRLAFNGDTSTFSISMFEYDAPNIEVLENLDRRVVSALHELVENKRKRDLVKLPTAALIEASRFEIGGPNYTREERKLRHQLQKEQALQKSKRKQKNTIGVVQDTEKETVKVVENEPFHVRNIAGLDYDIVNGYLQKERITMIDADVVIKKLEHLVELANINRKMLGKRISENVLSGDEIENEHINLRQINWIVDGGVTQIRIYLEDVKQSTFLLRGIMLKKNDTYQTRYLRKLLLDIVKERKARNNNVEAS